MQQSVGATEPTDTHAPLPLRDDRSEQFIAGIIATLSRAHGSAALAAVLHRVVTLLARSGPPRGTNFPGKQPVSRGPANVCRHAPPAALAIRPASQSSRGALCIRDEQTAFDRREILGDTQRR